MTKGEDPLGSGVDAVRYWMVPKVWAVSGKKDFPEWEKGKVYEKTALRRVPFQWKGTCYQITALSFMD